MFEPIFEAWSQPHTRHAMAVHVPIAFGLLTPVLFVVMACTGFRNRGIAAMTAVVVFLAMWGAGIAADAGEAAYQRAATESRPYLTTEEIDAMNVHERLGEGAWLYFVPTLLLSAALAFQWKKGWMRVSLGGLGLVASVFVVVWIGQLAHTGGMLVYDYGIGTPPRIPPR